MKCATAILGLLGLVVLALTKESPLKAILRSPTLALRLYNGFKSTEELSYSPTEDRHRFRLFRTSASFVAEANSNEDDTATYALNRFSTMTSAEQRSYLGLNVTDQHPGPPPAPGAPATSKVIPESMLWTDEPDKVTEVKDQGSCGSCWTFGAVGAVETRYAQISGVLRNFAEQEYLDCVYEGQRNGCGGGWPGLAFAYSQSRGGRLAAQTDYPYSNRDGKCDEEKPDAMVAAKIVSQVTVESSEQKLVEALSSGGVSVCFEVTNYSTSYSGGVLADPSCAGEVNHAVTAVGYTPRYILVKNSWGTWWGDMGYIKFGRGHHNCGLYNWNVYPVLQSTGLQDTTPGDTATEYRTDLNPPTPVPACVDEYSACLAGWCTYWHIREEQCRKTCGTCT